MELSFEELQQIMAAAASRPTHSTKHPYEIGRSYLFRTVTHIDIGIVREIVGDTAVLTDAAWIPDTGRYMDMLKSGKVNECEPYPHGCFVNLQALCDAAPWRHPPLKEQK